MTNVQAPDWKGFGEAIMDDWQAHGDIDAGDKFDLAVKFHILTEIPGGFDPEKHEDTYGCDTEPGDPWYQMNRCPASPAVAQGAVTVKPLDWKDTGIGVYPFDVEAKTSIGSYNAWSFSIKRVKDATEIWTHGWNRGGGKDRTECTSFEDAKNQAQTDYEQRILAALSQPQPEAVAYAREAICHAGNNLMTHIETHHDSEEETPEAGNLRHILHHLEGTLIGMDDATPPEARCSYCDGTGDVHRADGEWLGVCPDCATPPAREVNAQAAAVVAAYDRANPMRQADWHGDDCTCLRCEIDRLRALAGEGQ